MRLRLLKRLVISIGGVFFVLMAAVGGWYLWSWDAFGLRTPSDGNLISLFQTHQTAFRHLREMAIDDSGVIHDIDKRTLAQSRLPIERREEYLRVFSSIYPNLKVVVAPPAVTFIFTVGTNGLPLGPAPEWYKGIVYLPAEQERGADIVDSLDRLPRNTPYGDYLVRIEPNWYLIFSKMD